MYKNKFETRIYEVIFSATLHNMGKSISQLYVLKSVTHKTRFINLSTATCFGLNHAIRARTCSRGQTDEIKVVCNRHNAHTKELLPQTGVILKLKFAVLEGIHASPACPSEKNGDEDDCGASVEC